MQLVGIFRGYPFSGRAFLGIRMSGEFFGTDPSVFDEVTYLTESVTYDGRLVLYQILD